MIRSLDFDEMTSKQALGLAIVVLNWAARDGDHQWRRECDEAIVLLRQLKQAAGKNSTPAA